MRKGDDHARTSTFRAYQQCHEDYISVDRFVQKAGGNGAVSDLIQRLENRIAYVRGESSRVRARISRQKRHARAVLSSAPAATDGSLKEERDFISKVIDQTRHNLKAKREDQRARTAESLGLRQKRNVLAASEVRSARARRRAEVEELSHSALAVQQEIVSLRRTKSFIIRSKAQERLASIRQEQASQRRAERTCHQEAVAELSRRVRDNARARRDQVKASLAASLDRVRQEKEAALLQRIQDNQETLRQDLATQERLIRRARELEREQGEALSSLLEHSKTLRKMDIDFHGSA